MRAKVRSVALAEGLSTVSLTRMGTHAATETGAKEGRNCGLR